MGLMSGHARQALPAANAVGKIFAVTRFEEGFIIEEIVLGRPPRHKKIDNPLSFWSKMRTTKNTTGWLDGNRSAQCRFLQQVGERHSPQAERKAAKEISPRQAKVKLIAKHSGAEDGSLTPHQRFVKVK